MIPAASVDEAATIVATLDGPGEAWRVSENPVIAHAMASLARCVVEQDAVITALRAQNAYLAPRQQAGQLVANAIHELDPDFYEVYRGSDVDPFSHNENTVDYLRAWRESIRRRGEL